MVIARQLLATFALLGLAAVPCVAGAAWPRLQLPPQARVAQIGGPMRVDGLPMRLRVFSVAQPPPQVALWFLRELHTSSVARDRDGGLLLGAPRGHDWVTVQLARAGQNHTHGMIAWCDLRDAAQRVRAVRAAVKRAWRELPPDLTVLRDVSSVENGNFVQELIMSDDDAVRVNRTAIERTMRRRDFLPGNASVRTRGGQMLTFAAPHRRVVAVLVPIPGARTGIVLNIVTRPGGGP